MTAAFTVRVQDEVIRKLDKIAALSDRSRAYLAAQAIEDYVMREEWQLAEIQAGLAEADSQDFATAEDLGSVLAKHLRIGRNA
ncbi:CopG family ribbon-helix-helix protein [Brucella gallinifaecis]|uniref:CopG family ribbon-helix-helix protein n=1 Tax=Brucella gallinifaecis TaxID=215590 RepID=UPI00236196FE|nr:CopG family ribbon-helix-helix protein [Brucella gallinifaecis]